MLLLDLSPLVLAYCILVLLLNFTLRGSLGFGGALGLPLLALALPVKVIAPAWSLIGIVSSVAIVGRSRRHIDWRYDGETMGSCRRLADHRRRYVRFEPVLRGFGYRNRRIFYPTHDRPRSLRSG